jgi:hypothetical protein
LPSVVEVGEQPARPLQPDEGQDSESRRSHFSGKLTGPVEFGGREQVEFARTILMYSLGYVALDHLVERRIRKQVLRQSIECRGKTRNRGSE